MPLKFSLTEHEVLISRKSKQTHKKLKHHRYFFSHVSCCYLMCSPLHKKQPCVQF